MVEVQFSACSSKRSAGHWAGREGGLPLSTFYKEPYSSGSAGHAITFYHFVQQELAAIVQCTKQNGRAGNTISPTPGAELEKEIVYLVAKHELEMCTLSLALEWTNQPNQ